MIDSIRSLQSLPFRAATFALERFGHSPLAYERHGYPAETRLHFFVFAVVHVSLRFFGFPFGAGITSAATPRGAVASLHALCRSGRFRSLTGLSALVMSPPATVTPANGGCHAHVQGTRQTENRKLRFVPFVSGS
jgi:hypothetical protein